MWHPPINQSAFSDISCQDTQILKVGPLWKQNFTGSNSLQTSCWTDAFNNLLKLRLTDANLRCHLDRIKRRGSCQRCWWAGRLTSGWSASCFLALSPRLTLLTDCLPSGELWKNVFFFSQATFHVHAVYISFAWNGVITSFYLVLCPPGMPPSINH